MVDDEDGEGLEGDPSSKIETCDGIVQCTLDATNTFADQRTFNDDLAAYCELRTRTYMLPLTVFALIFFLCRSGVALALLISYPRVAALIPLLVLLLAAAAFDYRRGAVWLRR